MGEVSGRGKGKGGGWYLGGRRAVEAAELRGETGEGEGGASFVEINTEGVMRVVYY